MDAALKAKWTAALRSGEFKQGKGQLKNGDAYCCLGVLCVVAALDINADGSGVGGDRSYDPIFPLLGRGRADSLHDLWGRNDNGVPFSGIADYIDAHL